MRRRAAIRLDWTDNGGQTFEVLIHEEDPADDPAVYEGHYFKQDNWLDWKEGTGPTCKASARFVVRAVNDYGHSDWSRAMELSATEITAYCSANPP